MLIDLQLKYLENKLKKNCIYHKKQTDLFCFKLNCSKCPYMCQLCNKQGVHSHKDSIGNMNEFLKQMVLEIHDYENFHKNLVEADELSINSFIKQQTDILRSIQKLETQILEIINQSKEKIKKQIELNLERIKKTNNSRLKYYKNPNILVNKLISQSSIEFITKLKKSLLDRKQDTNQQNQKLASKNQINILKNNIKHLVQINLIDKNTTKMDNIIETKHSRIKNQSKVHVSEKKIYQLPILPSKIYNFNDRMIVCGDKTYLFNLEQKTAINIEPNMIFCASNKEKMKGQFLGISLPNILIYYSQTNPKKTTKIKNDATALAALCTRDQIYGVIGYQDGQIQCTSINNPNNSSKIKKHNGKINNISIIQDYNLIIVSSYDGKVSLNKYKYQDNALKIQFISYLTGTMEDLMGHQVYKKQIILYNLSGNIKIIDFNLNQVVLESNFTKQKAIVDMLVIPNPKGYSLLTLYKNEKQLKIWNIDRERSTYKIENTSLYIKKSDITKNSMFIWNDNLWILKQSLPEIHVATIDFL